MDFPQMVRRGEAISRFSESGPCGEEILPGSLKLCVDCKTSKTPLWRSGPAGPKSLCNACGIRYRKRNGGGSDKKKDKQPSSPSPSPSSPSSSSSAAAAAASSSAVAAAASRNRESSDEGCGTVGKEGKLRKTLRIKLVALGKEVVLMQRQRSPMKKKKKKIKQKRNFSFNHSHKKLGEVEQAAILLMSLSCGSVYA